MAQLLVWHHATVTVCHSRTKDLKSVVCKYYIEHFVFWDIHFQTSNIELISL